MVYTNRDVSHHTLHATRGPEVPWLVNRSDAICTWAPLRSPYGDLRGTHVHIAGGRDPCSSCNMRKCAENMEFELHGGVWWKTSRTVIQYKGQDLYMCRRDMLRVMVYSIRTDLCRWDRGRVKSAQGQGQGQGQGSGFAQQPADRRKRLRRFAPPPFPSVCRGIPGFVRALAAILKEGV